MYKVILNNRIDKNVKLSGNNKFSVDGREYEIERFDNDSRLLKVRNGKTCYKLQIHNVDIKSKTLQIKLDGVKHVIQVKDKFDLLLDELGLASRNTTRINQIKAPMPGLILEINVKPGDKVKKGDTILVLEAMKMENVIKSPGVGTVREIKIVQGDSVEKNQVLIQF